MLKQHKHMEAKSNYIKSLKHIDTLNEPGMESIVWHQLGRVAEEQSDWAEAEHWYRESLALKERLGDAQLASTTCNQLAIVARRSGRPAEAEGWYKRALELIEKVNPGGSDQAKYFNNLAYLLMNEVKHDRADRARLDEVERYAKQALAIRETLDASSEVWMTLSILADIADLEDHTVEARNYHRRERETFAAFEGNRYHIDQQHGQLIAAIVEAANGDAKVRAEVEVILPQLEAKNWKIASATRRIWEGERDWHSLVEGIDRNSALLILRVLETIAQPEEAQSVIPEQVFASLPVAIREAMERGDQAAFQQAFEALSPEEQQAVMEAIQFLQGQGEKENS